MRRSPLPFTTFSARQSPSVRRATLVPIIRRGSKVDNVVHALRHLVLVNQDRETPCWLDRRKGQPPRDLVACRNGILNLKTRELLPHDPQFFTMNCMPLKYNPDALWSKRWLKFLEELWPTTAQDDKTRKANKMAQECLREIVGYGLTADTSQQKIFLIVGPKRGGKGTIVWVLRQLLGLGKCRGPDAKKHDRRVRTLAPDRQETGGHHRRAPRTQYRRPRRSRAVVVDLRRRSAIHQSQESIFLEWIAGGTLPDHHQRVACHCRRVRHLVIALRPAAPDRVLSMGERTSTSKAG